MADRLGELLLRKKLITQEQLEEAIEEQRRSGGRLGFNLTKLGFIKEQDLTTFLSKQYGIPTVNINSHEIDPEVCKLIPEEVAKKYEVLPLSRTGSTLVLAMADPSNIFAIDDIKFLSFLQAITWNRSSPPRRPSRAPLRIYTRPPRWRWTSMMSSPSLTRRRWRL
jgi:type IV pilus assembly protein PilB